VPDARGLILLPSQEGAFEESVEEARYDERFGLITSIVRRTAKRIRHELLAKNSAGRSRAEEALVAIIAASRKSASK
jgi:hypothetical protein